MDGGSTYLWYRCELMHIRSSTKMKRMEKMALAWLTLRLEKKRA